MKPYSRWALASALLRTASWRERVGAAVVIILALGAIAGGIARGYFVGAHAGRPGWACGDWIKTGVPTCMRDPKPGL